jgi:hypothetical protein
MLSEGFGAVLSTDFAFVDTAIKLKTTNLLFCWRIILNSFFSGYWVKKSKKCLKFAFFEKVSIFSW